MEVELKIPIMEELNENIKVLIGLLCRNPEEPAGFNDEFNIVRPTTQPPVDATAPQNPPSTQSVPVASQSVETAEVAYSFEQLQTCAADVSRAGKREELFKALQNLGVTSIMELKPEQYNDFAATLRSLGGTI